MKTARFEVLSQQEIERIHAASMEIMADIGIKVDYGKARELFREAGAQVDEEMLESHLLIRIWRSPFTRPQSVPRRRPRRRKAEAPPAGR